MKRLLAACAAFGLWGLWLAPVAPLHAHEGHAHEDAAATAAAAAPLAASPRLSAQSADFELVATLEAGQLVVWLDRWADNVPVTDARIELDAPAHKGALAARGDGAYALAAPALATPGEHPLVFSIETAAAADLLGGVLVVPAAAATSGTAAGWGGLGWPAWAAVALGLLALMAAATTGGIAWQRRRSA